MNQIIAGVIILVAVGCNAAHDGMILRKPGVKWWPWHVLKWAFFYPPLVYIVVTTFSWWWWIPFGVGAWMLWRGIYNLTGGEK